MVIGGRETKHKQIYMSYASNNNNCLYYYYYSNNNNSNYAFYYDKQTDGRTNANKIVVKNTLSSNKQGSTPVVATIIWLRVRLSVRTSVCPSIHWSGDPCVGRYVQM